MLSKSYLYAYGGKTSEDVHLADFFSEGGFHQNFGNEH